MVIMWSKSTEQQYVFSYRENYRAHPQQKISFTNTTLTTGTPTLNAILIRPEERLYYGRKIVKDQSFGMSSQQARPSNQNKEVKSDSMILYKILNHNP